MDVKKANELVLGFDEKLMYGFGFSRLLLENYPEDIKIQGVSRHFMAVAWFKQCCQRSYFQPRGLIEEDPTFKQIIPYIVLRSPGKVFSYQRAGSEDRLAGNISIGVGGHVNMEDVPTDLDLTNAPKLCAQRELSEEVMFAQLSHTDRMKMVCLFDIDPSILYDPSDDVGKVHLGAVYIIDVRDKVAKGTSMKEEGISEEWLTIDELNEPEVWDNLEGWSKLVLQSGCL